MRYLLFLSLMKKALPLILLVILAVIALSLKQCNSTTNDVKPTIKNKKQTDTTQQDYSKRGLNRNPSHINYSKHASCRMDCRHIDEAEVQQILKEGKINYTKSELKGEDCKKKYAVEGDTKDNQKVRIILAPCADEVTVVTVIDLGKEWVCDCE
jgi:maltose-binding protein MalE